MRNLFRNPFKHRGLSDNVHHDGNLQHNLQQHEPATLIPVSAPPKHSPPHHGSSSTSAPASSVSEPSYPAGYPNTNNTPSYNGHNNHPHAIQPVTAYPYGFSQDHEKEKAGAEWEFNAGRNVNKKGQQRGGNINAGNISTVTGSAALPQNGRFVFNTGSNYNEGDFQESGNVEFVNSHVGLH